jgi:hypothetical protein
VISGEKETSAAVYPIRSDHKSNGYQNSKNKPTKEIDVSEARVAIASAKAHAASPRSQPVQDQYGKKICV